MPLSMLIGVSSAAQAQWHHKRDGNCTAMPLGKGPVPTPDSVSEFLQSDELSSPANNAPTPSNYTQSFKNLHGSSTANNYLGYITLDSYDINACASNCTSQSDCQAINIFFERDPTLDVGPECQNPPSTTTIKCVFWGSAVAEQNTQNEGYHNYEFVVAIAGSNGYCNERAEDVKK